MTQQIYEVKSNILYQSNKLDWNFTLNQTIFVIIRAALKNT